MARQPASAHTSKAKGSVPKAKGRAGSAQKQARAARASRAQASEEPRLFDERTRRDVTGVAVSVLAVALFAAAVLPSEAVVTSFLSTALHLSLGLGAYVLPFLLLIIGASFLVRFERERVPARVAVGLVMIFVAALSLLALFTPAPAPDATDNLFSPDELAARGGLTPRETEVFDLLARGRSVPYVRDALVISRETAATHAKHVYAKLGVHSRQELIDLVH